MRKTRNAPIRPAKNIASAPKNMRTASHALLAICALGRTGGGGSPPPKPGRLTSRGTEGSAIFRAVELCAIDPPVGLLKNDKKYHRRNIQHGQNRQPGAEAPVTQLHSMRRPHHRFAHNGTRSSA